MTRQVFNFASPERFVVGTVGMPGERTFFLQARQDGQITSVVIEKAQASALAERIDQLLDEVRARGHEEIPQTVTSQDNGPLDTPILEEFRVGAMALGWDESSSRVVVEAHAVVEDDTPVPDIGDDSAAGADTLRVWLDASMGRAFADRTRSVVSAGRPACPFCAQPLDPDGHICPRANGYRRRG